MAQHDYNIANQTGLEFRVDLNNALQAVVTDNSGATAPSTTFPGMVWRDTSSSPSVLKKRTDADDGWVTILTASGEAITGASSASDQRTALGLGTAATLNVGTAANNIVQLDGTAKLPAVDGSNLTGIVPTYPTQTGNAGKFLSTNGTTASWEFVTSIGSAVSASGTSIDFTGIPSGVNRVTINLDGISTNGSSNYLVQIGDSGGVSNSGYLGSASAMGAAVGSASFTTGIGIIAGASTVVIRGSIVFNRINSNSWIAHGVCARSDISGTVTTAGSKTLTGVLDRIRLTTVNGTDTFDAGTVNILLG